MPQNRTIREKILIDLEIINLDILDEGFYEYQDDLEVMVKNYIVEHKDILINLSLKTIPRMI
ncbi:hypothetical protein NSA58_19015 [Terrisporobacter sp. DSM 29186]|uniref:Uncharacterized protein n=1 Tax=Terrisporobacter muris TaxID=2963284 RepID=A0A9X2MFM9_9FIRM|nr:hypothetical protein [Terrisporobacter muris]